MLSIIIPTLNEEKILERTLTSLHRLRSCPYEIIVSDGASKDRTAEIAAKYADSVIVYDGTARQTIGQGRNLGALHAQGDFLVFVDADVFIPDIDNFFLTALRQFTTNPDLVGLTVFLKVLPETITLSDRLFFSTVNRLYQFFNNFLHIGAASGEFQMIKTESFKKIGGYNPKMVVGEDNDLFVRLGKIGSTRVATGLHVMHTSRRAHNIGWTRLLYLWIANFLYAQIAGKSLSKEWKDIR